MGELIGGVLATAVLLQGSFFIGTQDFGGRAMPFGFCHMKKRRAEYLICCVDKRAKQTQKLDDKMVWGK